MNIFFFNIENRNMPFQTKRPIFDRFKTFSFLDNIQKKWPMCSLGCILRIRLAWHSLPGHSWSTKPAHWNSNQVLQCLLKHLEFQVVSKKLISFVIMFTKYWAFLVILKPTCCHFYQLGLISAPSDLQPHYGNEVFGNVHLLALDNTR